MKTKLIIVSVVAVLVLAAVGGLLLLRGEEDNWICENGAWIKHGNPKGVMPETPCGGASEKIIDQPGKIPPSESDEDNSELIGGEKDEHGCLIPAGYTWCEEKQKCLRTWEEECSAAKKEDSSVPAPVPQPLPLPAPDSTSKSAPAPNLTPAPSPSPSTSPSNFSPDMPAPLPLP